MADVATLGLKVDASGAVRALKDFDNAADKAAVSGTRLEKVTGHIKTAMAGLAGAAIVGVFYKTVQETIAAQHAMAQLEAAVRSTGGAAGYTAQQLHEMSVAMMRRTTFSDETVKAAQAVLLLNENLRGLDFERTLQLSADLATRMGTNMADAAKLLGRALQDPAMATMALNRAGIVFDMSQTNMLKAMMKVNDTAGAQAMMLTLLEKKLSGSAAAARDTLGGALAALGNAWGDLFEVSERSTQGTVDGINAITRALEHSGISMDRIIGDAVKDWETMRASIEKVHRIMSLQIDRNFMANARAIIREVDAELEKTLARLNAPAKTVAAMGAHGPLGMVMDDDAAEKAAKAAAKAAEEGARIYEDILKRREQAAIDAMRRQIETMTSTLSDRISGGILGGLRGALGPMGGLLEGFASEFVGRFVRKMMVLRGGADIRSAMDLNDIADASKSLEPPTWQKGLGAAAAGGMMGYGLGQSMRSGTGGLISGGAFGFMAGNAILPGLGGAIGGLAGALGGLIGGLTGSAEAAKRAKIAFEDFNRSVEFYVAESKGDTTGARIVAEQQRAEELRRQAAQRFESAIFMQSRGIDSPGYQEYLRVLAQINEAERARIAAIKDEEKAVRDLNGQLLNLGAGYKLAAQVFRAMDPLASRPTDSSPTPQTPPAVPGKRRTTDEGVSPDTPIVLQLDGEVLARGTLRQFMKRASATFGDAAQWPKLSTVT